MIPDTQMPRVIRAKGLSIQACVPKQWTDEQVVELAERQHPCGTEQGWFIRKSPDERVTCYNNADWVHIVLDA